MIMIETLAYLQPNFQIPISNHRSNIGAEFGKVEHNNIWLHILQPTWILVLFLAPTTSSHRTMIWGSIVDNVQAIAHNELGYTTLSVAEPRRGVSVGASSCIARSVTEDNVPLGRARAKVPSVACQPKLADVARCWGMDADLSLPSSIQYIFSLS